MDATNLILSDDRAADLLGTLTGRVRKWVKAGQLPGRQLPDGTVVVLLPELTEWVKQGLSLPHPASIIPDLECSSGAFNRG